VCGSHFTKIGYNGTLICAIDYGFREYDATRTCLNCGGRVWIENRDTGRIVCGACHPNREATQNILGEFGGFPSYVDTILAHLTPMGDGGPGWTADELAQIDGLDRDYVGVALAYLRRNGQVTRIGQGDTARYWRTCVPRGAAQLRPSDIGEAA
jgi:hypothetical protein